MQLRNKRILSLINIMLTAIQEDDDDDDDDNNNNNNNKESSVQRVTLLG